jgi:DNA-binding NarL/FixJ family response regulator
MPVMAINGEAAQAGAGRDGDVSAMSGLRVILAEDDILLREGLASLLERSGFAVVGQAGGGTQLLALVRQEAPELVVVDIRMPPTHTAEGLEAARVIRQELVAELISARRRNDPLAVLSTREREVLALMAEGRSNAGIGRRLWVTEGTVEKHVRSILAKLRLPETDEDHRRVLAVVTFLESR